MPELVAQFGSGTVRERRRSGEAAAIWLWRREGKERGSPNQMAWMLNY